MNSRLGFGRHVIHELRSFLQLGCLRAKIKRTEQRTGRAFDVFTLSRKTRTCVFRNSDGEGRSTKNSSVSSSANNDHQNVRLDERANSRVPVPFSTQAQHLFVVVAWRTNSTMVTHPHYALSLNLPMSLSLQDEPRPQDYSHTCPLQTGRLQQKFSCFLRRDVINNVATPANAVVGWWTRRDDNTNNETY